MKNSQTISLKDGDDIEGFFFENSGMRTTYLPLSDKPGDIVYRFDNFDGVTLSWCRGTGRARWIDQTTGPSLHIGFPVEKGGALKFCGEDVREDQVQVWVPGYETELIMSPPYSTLEIGVDHAIVDKLGWRFDGDPIRQIPARLLRRLTRTCVRASQSLDDCRRVENTSLLGLWREQVLDELEAALDPWLLQIHEQSSGTGFGTRNFHLVKRADEYLGRALHSAAFDIERLADELGVSRRTLYYVFRKHLGVTPRRYFELKRLQALRSALLDGSPDKTTVTGTAVGFGFTDMGRLATLYKRQFGEYPRETLCSQ